MKTKVAAIVGPTAVGKTEVSLEVAERLDAEIVSVDSMQIYRGMDVGTAKADARQRARAPHHLLDLLDPSHPLTVSQYQELGRAAIEDIAGRGRLPLLVGGSGLYFRSIVDELSFPPRSEEVRMRLEDEAGELGPAALYARLQEVDPGAARKIEPGNVRRTVRALEVIEVTGRPFSDNVTWDAYESIFSLAVAGLRRDRSELYERVAARVDAMLDEGLVEEARALAEGMGTTARQALGYRQILDAPGAPPQEVRDAIVRATKRFARRQESWFASDPRVCWFDAASGTVAEELESYFKAELALT